MRAQTTDNMSRDHSRDDNPKKEAASWGDEEVNMLVSLTGRSEMWCRLQLGLSHGDVRVAASRAQVLKGAQANINSEESDAEAEQVENPLGQLEQTDVEAEQMENPLAARLDSFEVESMEPIESSDSGAGSHRRRHRKHTTDV